MRGKALWGFPAHFFRLSKFFITTLRLHVEKTQAQRAYSVA